MGYVYDFDIASILFFGLTMFFYLRQRRLKNLQDSIFTAMLIASMTAIVFDFASSSMEGYAMRHPVWLLYLVNALFIFGMQSCLPLFFLYAVAVAGKFNRFSRRTLLLFALPYLVTMALLLLSPFSTLGIFRIDGAHIYQRSTTYMALYINMSFYVLAGLAVLLRNGRRVERAKRNVIFMFVIILFVATVLQVTLRRYLLTASATGLALTSLFYVLQSPVDQLNPLTGAFNRTLLPSLLRDYAEAGRTYTLLTFSLRSFDDYIRLYGPVAGDELLQFCATRFIKRFSQGVVVYMDTSEFIVVYPGRLSRAEAEKLYLESERSIVLEGRTVELDFRMGAAPGEVDGTVAGDIANADYMLREMRISPDCPGLLYADEAYRRNAKAVSSLQAAIDNLLRTGGGDLALEPVLTDKGQVAMLEARFRLPEEIAAYVSYDQFLQAVGQQGDAAAYYRTVLTALKEKQELFHADKKLCLPMLSAAFLHEDGAEDIREMVESLGFVPNQILFFIGEPELASSLPVLEESVRRLSERGFAFMVDDFAEGYTDLSLLISLPLGYARIHRDLVRSAVREERGAALLTGLVEVLTDVGIATVCPGIDTEADERAARRAGARLFQGAYISGEGSAVL